VNLTEQFTEQLFTLTNDAPPADVLGQFKRCLIDYLGVTTAGSAIAFAKVQDSFLKYVEPGSVSAIGIPDKLSLYDAIHWNGLSAHMIELDDGDRRAMLHPGAVVFSALLPLAERFDLDTDGFTRGAIAGYQAALSLGRVLQPELKLKGYHGTGVCGTIAAAVAASVALGQDRTRLKNAISASATAAAGILKMIEPGSFMKPLNVANAAVNGVRAALSSALGTQGPDDVMSGEHGFLRIFGGPESEDRFHNLKPDFLIREIYFKPYAACRHCHAPIEAALTLRSQLKNSFEDIRKIEIHTYHLAVKRHDHTFAADSASAKMSIPVSVAIALILGKAGLEEFRQANITLPAIASTAAKVSVYANDELSAMVPEKRPARVILKMVGGERIEHLVELPVGEPENPISNQQLSLKAVELMKSGNYSPGVFERISESVWDTSFDIRQLLQMLQQNKNNAPSTIESIV
jgi:2-methylcitrate dehydratase PrpD